MNKLGPSETFSYREEDGDIVPSYQNNSNGNAPQYDRAQYDATPIGDMPHDFSGLVEVEPVDELPVAAAQRILDDSLTEEERKHFDSMSTDIPEVTRVAIARQRAATLRPRNYAADTSIYNRNLQRKAGSSKRS